MKIAMITFSCAFNYGAILQTYGLYCYLESKGHEVEIIDYIPDRYNLDAKDYADHAIQRTRFWKYIPCSKIIWKNTRLKQMKENRLVFRHFLECKTVLTHKYFSFEELQADIPKADLYITGSDQVWNPEFVWNGEIDKPYFLAFLPDTVRRISYASSFGKDALTEDEWNEIQGFLAKYDLLSVRERNGVDIIRNMGLTASEVADPTILLGREAFARLAEENEQMKEPYMLLFQINFNQQLFDMCKKVADENEIRLIPLIPDVFQASKCRSDAKLILPSVEAWIGYFMHANYIVTDSFHATVFSIMFERPFSSYVSVGYNGRIYNILNKTGLEERILFKADGGQFLIQFKKLIDYHSVKQKMAFWQEESKRWLDTALMK